MRKLIQTAASTDLVEELWHLRVNHRIEECLRGISALRQRLNLSTDHRAPADFAEDEPATHLASSDLAEYLLLQGSIARFHGRIAEANDWNASARRILDHCGLGATFRLSIETGLTAFAAGEYTLALDEFLQAETTAKPGAQQLLALVNTLLCLENLGLPYAGTLKKIKQAQCSQKTISPATVEDQLRAFKARESFRRGRIRDALGYPQRIDELFGQGDFYRLWAISLPYHLRYLPELENRTQVQHLIVTYGFYNRNFRIRTLQALLHPDDLRQPRLSDICDRVYLWTWKWLSSPEKFPAQRILQQLIGSGVMAESHRLTAEDRQLLMNVLLWLGLFDATADRRVDEWAGAVADASSASFPLFELERLVIRYFTARRDGDDLLAGDLRFLLESHELWASEDLRFRALVISVESETAAKAEELGPLSGLVNFLRDLMSKQRAPLSAKLVVDESRAETLGVGDRRVRSQSLAVGLAQLIRNPNQTCEDFSAACFGIRLYDPTIHAAKIFNLLSRMREVLPEGARVGVKSGRVFRDGDWSGVYARSACPYQKSLVGQSDWTSLLAQTKTGSVATSTPARVDTNELRNIMTRKDFEVWLKTSRATAGRILAKWERSGWIVREGSARAARYRLEKRFRKELALSADLRRFEV